MPHALSIAGPAVRRPFVLSAPRGRVEGDEIDGTERVEVDGTLLVAGVGLHGARASNLVVSPRALRRELLLGGRSWSETVRLPERSAAVLFEWRPGSGAGGTGAELRIGLPAPGDVVARSDGTLRVDLADGAVRLYRIEPPPGEWPDPAGVGGTGVRTVRARVDPGDGGSLTLVAGLGADDRSARAALDAGARGKVHDRRAEAALVRARDELPALRTGVSEIDEALEWAKARLEAPAPGTADLSILDRVLVASGRAAAGLRDGAREALDDLPVGSAGALLAEGMVAAWSGSVDPGRRGEILEAAGRLLEHLDGGAAEDRVVTRAAVAAAADLLDGTGARADASALRDALAAPPAVPSGGTGAGPPGGIALPVVGGRSPAPAAEKVGGRAERTARLLAAALGVDTDREPGPTAGVAPDADAVETGLAAWALFRTGRPEEGYLALRSLLGRPWRGPRGCWGRDRPEPRPDDPAATALVPLAVLHGLLGADPDASFGRIRLGPALPTSWTSFRMTGIRVGAAVLELACRVEGSRHTFVLRPTAGPVPPNVVFEPSIAGAIAAVEIDGRAADVEVRSAGGRTGASLQLPIDRERKVTLVRADETGR